MKKLSTIIMALALVLGMSQCKKQETNDPATPNANEGVYITVNAGGNDGKDDNGDKHAISPAHGLFAFQNNDVLYVGHGGRFAGTLTFNNGFFSGTIYPNYEVENQPLHFYFLGNAALSEALPETIEEGTEITSRTISIADQSQNLPVLSYGVSTKPFTSTGTTYSATLKNKCALVRFDLQLQGDYEVTLSNVPTLATVDFENNAITPNTSTTGDITLYGESGNTMYRWAILLPGTNLSPTVHTDLTWNGEGELPVMGNNTYINSGLGINNTLPLPDPPTAEYAVRTSGNVMTKFSVGVNKKVYFSRANLRAEYNNNSFPVAWSLPNDHYPYNQYLEVSGGITEQPYGYHYTYHVGGNYINFSSSYGDRFTWGYSNQYEQTGDDFCHENHDLSTDNASYADWGYVLKGTAYGDHWRTLSQEEWNYLLFERSGKRFLKVQLDFYDQGLGNVCTGNKNNGESIYGIFVFPDGYDGQGLSGSYTFNDATADFITGQYLQIHSSYFPNNDAKKMLEAGAVFLPAAGYRDGSQYMEYDYYSNDFHNASVTAGYYWTSSHVFHHPDYATNYQACAVSFDKNGIHTTEDDMMYRQYGCCVRLVWDADPN